MNNSEKKVWLKNFAEKQWLNDSLRKWRSRKTKEQWTPEFREKRIHAYNQTYLRKALAVLKDIQEKFGTVNEGAYNEFRKNSGDRSLIRLDTIRKRFFDNDYRKLEAAVVNYNHKIKAIIPLLNRIDVYDIEVSNTHNFALASGVFVHNSAKSARNRRFQAILPLRGKILNVEKARLDKMLASKEIRSLIIALGTAIGDDYDQSRLRYHRIIIATDADVDGSHIRTLLLTLFFRYFPQLIDGGDLYIAEPPLYRIQKGRDIRYAYSDDEKERIIKEVQKIKEEKVKLKSDKNKSKKEEVPEEAVAEDAVVAGGEEGEGGEKIKGITVQRYKGLGEMNPGQLWDTTMDPSHRVMRQVNMKSASEADRIFDILMGDEVLPRKKFIQTYAKAAKNLDI